LEDAVMALGPRCTERTLPGAEGDAAPARQLPALAREATEEVVGRVCVWRRIVCGLDDVPSLFVTF
jgi:hypothetical protein